MASGRAPGADVLWTVLLLTLLAGVGQSVARLVDRVQAAGVHEITFDAAGLTSGVYFYRLRAERFARTAKMMLVE